MKTILKPNKTIVFTFNLKSSYRDKLNWLELLSIETIILIKKFYLKKTIIIIKWKCSCNRDRMSINNNGS